MELMCIIPAAGPKPRNVQRALDMTSEQGTAAGSGVVSMDSVPTAADSPMEMKVSRPAGEATSSGASPPADADRDSENEADDIDVDADNDGDGDGDDEEESAERDTETSRSQRAGRVTRAVADQPRARRRGAGADTAEVGALDRA